MFSRLSGALGCPRSKEHSSTDDSVPDSENWLSQSVRSSTVFVVPAPNLQEVLHAAGVSWSSMTGQFYFDKLTTNTSSERQNPWSVAHSARQRSKLVELLVTQADDLSWRVVRELRHLATNCDENLVISSSATFADLLIPLLTEKPLSLDGLNNDGNDNMSASTLSDDVLILFGSPATTFQLLLSVSSLRSLLTELIMELVATSSPHSIRLLEQFKQPVGLTAMFGGKRAFAETATRLLELFQVVSEPTIQASILTILPDLASSPCAANCALTDEDRATLILKLTDLLGTTPTGTLKTVQQQADPIACLIECLTSFSVDRQLAVRLPDTLFELLDRCYTPEAYYAYLPLITRSLVIHGPAISRQSTELTKLTRRLRTYFKFPETPIESTGDSIETTLMELLRVAFQFNRQLMVDWMHAIDTSNVLQCEATEGELQIFHDQAVQDFLILCIIHSAADTQIASGPTGLRHTGSNPTCLGDPGGGGSAGAVGQVTRLQNEAGTLARRLVASGRLFPEPLRRNSLLAFFTSYGSLLTNTQHRLFPALLYFIDQLITSPCSNSVGLSSSSVDMSASVRAVGSAMYTGLFCAPVCIGDQRRCIVTHLVRHGLSCLPDPEKISRIRRGTTKQKAVSRTGLLALFRLARIRPSDLAQFDTILFGMMDRVIRVVTAWTLASPAMTSDSSNSTWHSDQAYTNLMRITRLIVLVLAWLGFCDRQQRSIQERLLAILRKQLSSLCLVSKALGVIGAVMVLETICRRSPTPPVDPDHADELQVSTQNDESIVLASQLTHVDQGRASTSTTSTSRTSTTSCLSLRGPGTLMADDPHEIHIPIEDTEGDPDDLDEHSRTTRTSDSVLVTRVHTPPSRLLLQLIGLVEHATGSCSQLYTFWLDELGACFVRLAHSRSDGNPPAKVQSDASPIKAAPKRLFGIPPTVQADRLLAWMGARVLRDFQDEFVMDNAPLGDHNCQLNLNDLSMCEVAIAIGPTWRSYRSGLRKHVDGAVGVLDRKVFHHPPNPLILPAQLRLIGITESVRLCGRLDAIDALLGCPVLLPVESRTLSDRQPMLLPFSPNEEDEAVLLVCTANWCVEVINLFAWHVITSDTWKTCADGSLLSVQCATCLARLTHVAHLRCQLYSHLIDCERRSTVRFESTDSGEEAHTFSTICLPTVTYEPGKAYTTHTGQFSAAGGQKNEWCFTCGIHPDPQLGKSSVTARRPSGLKSSKSKCASKTGEPCETVQSLSGETKRPRNMSGSSRDVHSSTRNSGPSDVDLDEADHSGGESNSSDDDDNVNEDNRGYLDNTKIGKDKVDKLSGESTKHSRGNKMVSKMAAGVSRRTTKMCVLSPSLDQMTACFRELDLAALVLGLSAWPWISEVTTSGVCTRLIRTSEKKNSFDTVDWFTLSWLLDDLYRKVLHLTETNTSASYSSGWYAYERFDNLAPHLRSRLLVQLVPCLQRVLNTAIDFLANNHHLNDSDVISSVSSSSNNSVDETGISGTPVPIRLNRSNPTSPAVPVIPSDQATRAPAMCDPGQFVSNVVCCALASMFMLCHRSPCPSSGASGACLRGNLSDSIGSVCDQFTVSFVSQLAKACVDSDSTNTRQWDLDVHGKWNVDYFLCVDQYDEHIVRAQENSDTSHLSSDLHTILEWLFAMAPDGLPHIVAASLHCRLVFYLADLYTTSLKTQTVPTNFSNPNWSPDLFIYTKSLLDQEWDTCARWKNMSYRGSLQHILGLHLRTQPCTAVSDTGLLLGANSSSFSPHGLVEFTQTCLLPTLRRYHSQNGHGDGSSEEHNGRPGGYRTLTRSTAELYCIEVMDTVLWFMRQLCATTSSVPGTDENLLLTGWNELVVILCLLVDLIRPSSSRLSRSRQIDESMSAAAGSPFLGLLPNLMRVGRLFLEGLLRSAMPLFSTLFPYRGVEVTTLLRNIQSLTRFLQRVCTHAKAYRNARLANQIPVTRRCLETFVYRVKTMLSQNQCAEAFWLGTLKNRDLDGVELQDDSLSSCRTSTSLMGESGAENKISTRGRRGRGRGRGLGRQTGAGSSRCQSHNCDNEDSDTSNSTGSEISNGAPTGRRNISDGDGNVSRTSMHSATVRLDRIAEDVIRNRIYGGPVGVVNGDLDEGVEEEEGNVDEELGNAEEDEGDITDEADVETVADGEEHEKESSDGADDVLIDTSDEEVY